MPQFVSLVKAFVVDDVRGPSQRGAILLGLGPRCALACYRTDQPLETPHRVALKSPTTNTE